MDQFRELKPGDSLTGFPSKPWNKMLDGIKGGPRPKRAAGIRETSVEFDVENTTDEELPQFAILGVNDPFTPFSEDADAFFNNDDLKGVTPSSNLSFVVLQEPVGADEFARARLHGITRVKLYVTDETHQYAGPTDSTEFLTTASRGPARIIRVESDQIGSSLHWAVVDLLGNAIEETAFVRVRNMDEMVELMTPTGYDPGVVTRFLPAVDDWEALYRCIIRGANGEDLVVGGRYLAKFFGFKYHDDIMSPVYVTFCCPVGSGPINGGGDSDNPSAADAELPDMPPPTVSPVGCCPYPQTRPIPMPNTLWVSPIGGLEGSCPITYQAAPAGAVTYTSETPTPMTAGWYGGYTMTGCMKQIWFALTDTPNPCTFYVSGNGTQYYQKTVGDGVCYPFSRTGMCITYADEELFPLPHFPWIFYTGCGGSGLALCFSCFEDPP